MEQNNYNGSEQNNSMNSEAQNLQPDNSNASFQNNYSQMDAPREVPPQNYYASSASYYNREEMAPPMTLSDFFIMFLILMIPIVNVIMLFVWGFSSDTNPNKSNFCKAQLIMMAITFVLMILLWGMIFAFVMAILQSQDAAMLF